MTVATYLLFALGCLGAIDIAIYHCFAHGIRSHPDSRLELIVHSFRGPIYALLFLVVPNFVLHGVFFWCLLAVLGFDVGVSIIDFILERNSRRFLGGLPSGEYVLHMIMAMVFGAFATAVFFAANDWSMLPSQIVYAPAASVWLRCVMAVMAIMVFISGIQDAIAVYNLRGRPLRATETVMLLLLCSVILAPATHSACASIPIGNTVQVQQKSDAVPKTTPAPPQAPASEEWNQTASRLARSLESSEYAVVLAAERELLAIRSPEAVPALEGIYRGVSAMNRARVAAALGNIAGAGSSVALARIAVMDRDGLVRIAALDRLKDRSASRADYQHVFSEAIQSKRQPFVNNAAAGAAHLKLASMIPFLSRALVAPENPRERYNYTVHKALVDICGQDFGFNSTAWLQWWSMVQRTGVRPDLTGGAVTPGDNPPTAADRARESRNGDDAAKGGSASKDANESPKKSLFRLAIWLESGNPDLVSRAVTELSALRDPDAVPSIMENLPKVGPLSRVEFVNSLGNIEDKRASVALAIVAVVEPDYRVRQRTMEVLRRRPVEHRSDYQRILIQALHSRVAQWIDYSAATIAEMNAVVLIPALIEALDAPIVITEQVTLEKSYTFFSLGTGKVFGTIRESPTRVYRNINAGGVVQALKDLTGQDYGASTYAWQKWWSVHRTELLEGDKGQ